MATETSEEVIDRLLGGIAMTQTVRGDEMKFSIDSREGSSKFYLGADDCAELARAFESLSHRLKQRAHVSAKESK
jgi:hypothetical protein